MKFMNNHYGQSRIFGKARFMVEPAGEGDNGIGTGSGAGGSSDGGDGDGGSSDDDGDDGLSIEELKLQLAREKADKEKFKNSVDKLTKTNKELTEKTRKYMTDEQKAAAAQEERDKELEELKREVRVSKYSKRLVGIGMTEAEADDCKSCCAETEDPDV